LTFEEVCARIATLNPDFSVQYDNKEFTVMKLLFQYVPRQLYCGIFTVSYNVFWFVYLWFFIFIPVLTNDLSFFSARLESLVGSLLATVYLYSIAMLRTSTIKACSAPFTLRLSRQRSSCRVNQSSLRVLVRLW